MSSTDLAFILLGLTPVLYYLLVICREMSRMSDTDEERLSEEESLRLVNLARSVLKISSESVCDKSVKQISNHLGYSEREVLWALSQGAETYKDVYSLVEG